MRVTIIPEENQVYVEGKVETVDCSSVDQEIHAIQWYDGRGEIEYKTDYSEGFANRKMNFMIVDFSPYQHLVDLWMIEAQKELPPPLEPIEPPPPKALEKPFNVITE